MSVHDSATSLPHPCPSPPPRGRGVRVRGCDVRVWSPRKCLGDFVESWNGGESAPPFLAPDKRESAPMNQMYRFLRRWLVRAALNLALLTALFFGAAKLDQALAPWWPEIPNWTVITAAV